MLLQGPLTQAPWPKVGILFPNLADLYLVEGDNAAPRTIVLEASFVVSSTQFCWQQRANLVDDFDDEMVDYDQGLIARGGQGIALVVTQRVARVDIPGHVATAVDKWCPSH